MWNISFSFKALTCGTLTLTTKKLKEHLLCTSFLNEFNLNIFNDEHALSNSAGPTWAIMWPISLHGPHVSVCTPNNVCACSSWEGGSIFWGISSQIWIKASESSVCGFKYITSQRFSMGYRSGKHKGYSMASVPLSSRNCYPLGHMRQALLSPLQQHKVSQCWLTCGGLCDYHWATAEQAMLEKVKHSITFTMASPDFRCCYMCSVWNSSHLWKQHRPSSYGASTGPTKGQWALKPHFASDCLVGKMHMSSPLEVIS